MFARSWHDRRGTISIFAAMAFPVLIGLAGLATEYGNGLATRVKVQRIADLAASGGAVAYINTGTTAALDAAVARVATLNGIDSNAATARLDASPTGNGNAVIATVTAHVPLMLSRVMGVGDQLTISATAYAELKTSAGGGTGAGGVPCIIALKGNGTGVTLSGGTAVSAPGCAVASNASVTAPNGTSITTPVVYYNSSAPPSTQTVANIHPPSGTSAVTYTKKATTDPLSGNAAVTSATAHLGDVAALISPTVNVAANLPYAMSNSSGVAFNWNSINGTLPSGCAAIWSETPSANWTVNCSSGGPYHFGKISVGGGIRLNFNPSGAASNVYTFANSGGAGDIDLSGGTAFTFGPGTYEVQRNIVVSQNATFAGSAFYIQGYFQNTNGNTTFQSSAQLTFQAQNGIFASGGSNTVFNAGTFRIGPSSSSCNGSTNYSICNLATALTINGPSTFTLAGGIYNGGSSTLTLAGR